ncbi:flavocytochrome c [Alkalibaculum sp. M08DMB]|uniref:Flavocytochrome c n=1 Tax=Alkalibaculum sporogenes TaxID=2655001 RepID=A0A6A7K513_9FIRM|nr:flavocytochrome c [Alkalibaculum sporogenes]MPW24470.1 flavocytochrome c [Alkalibaculum sporogenes]
MFKKKRKIISVILVIFMIIGVFAGCSSDAATSGEVKDYDVVVVGAGAAGLASAIEAAEAGASVAVLEKMPMVGGSTILSAGIIYAANSKLTEAAGVEDNAEDLVDYWMDRSEGKADEELVRIVAEESGATIDWLTDVIGVKFTEGMTPMPMGISPVPRGHWADGGGNGIISPMKTYAESKGVEFFMETSAKKLIADENGEVTGVNAVNAEDEEIIFNAKAVILASGGFDRNEELMSQYIPEAAGQMTFVASGNTGDGMLMAQELGADVVGNGSVIGFKAVEGEVSDHSPIASLVFTPALIVNLEGERFINEAIDYPIAHEEMLKQKDMKSFMIFDKSTPAETKEVLDDAVEKGMAYVSDSLEELAEKAGVNKETFLDTVESYNTMIDNNDDTQYGKDLTNSAKVEESSFYALKLKPASIGVMVGIKTDLYTHVINEDGNIIPNLFAAGEVANGSFYYKVYPASGTSIQMCLTLGRIAGANAASNLSK